MAARVLAFKAWFWDAIAPPETRAEICRAAPSAENALAASIAPAGTRTNVRITSQAESAKGILSTTNSTQ